MSYAARVVVAALVGVTLALPAAAQNEVTERFSKTAHLDPNGTFDLTNVIGDIVITGTTGQARLYNWLKLEIDGKAASEGLRDGPGQLDALAELIAGRPTPLASFEEATGVVTLVETLLSDAG